MPHRKNTQVKKAAAKTAPVSPIFDTALPLALRDIGTQTTGTSTPRVRAGLSKQTPLSPYVIRLSREQEDTMTTSAPVETKSKDEAAIEALMQQLLNADADLEKEEEESEVLVDFLDLMSQVREDLPVTMPDLRTPIRAHKAAWHTEEITTPLAQIPLASFDINAILPEPATESTSEQSATTTQQEVAEEEILQEETATEEFIENAPRTYFPAFLGQIRYRMTASFVALSLLFVLPIHAMQEFSDIPSLSEDITNNGNAATDQLKNGGDALLASDYALAANHFEEAAIAFGDIESQVNEATKGIGLIASVIPQSSRALRTTEALVNTGESLSEVARTFATAIADIDAHKTLSPTEKIQLFETYLEASEGSIRTAADAVTRIDISVIPDTHQETVQKLLEAVPALLGNVSHLREYLAASQAILGGDEQKSYLLVFQNNAELRPTGGFMGSFAEVKVNQGKIEDILVPTGGTYDIQGQMAKFVSAPGPLQLINPRWEFQDANWFPDFRMSAKKILEFHEAAGGPTMDGVIAVNASVLPDLLAITGPITVDGKELNAENVLFELQRRDETTEDAPKALVASLTTALFQKLEESDAKTMLAVSDVLFSALSEQEIQLYMRNPEIAALVHKLHWSGAQMPYSLDTLQVISTNIGGGKSDASVDQHVDLQVNIGEDGSIINTLTITKTHRGIASTVFQGVNNVDYVRAYVPLGSEILSAEGFDERPDTSLFETSEIPLEIDQDLETTLQHYRQDNQSKTDIWDENGFTVFGNWMQTKPGETETVTIRYKLPESAIASDFAPDLLRNIKSQIGFKQVGNYSLVLQKQSGAKNRTTDVHVTYPTSWKEAWTNIPTKTIDNTTNHVIQALFERP